MIKELQLRVNPKTAAVGAHLRKEVARRIALPEEKINDLRIIRRSIDARQRNVMVNLTVKVATEEDKTVPSQALEYKPKDVHNAEKEVIIVGSGPAGLFAAMQLLEEGIRPIVLERGEDVDSRRLSLAKLARTGMVNPESNYSFGEGGAGTYSDGKLYTRSTKRGNVKKVLSIFHRFGADENILVDTHPHIGSDRLPLIIKNMRNTILEKGGEVYFNKKVTGLTFEDEDGKRRITGVICEDGSEFPCNDIILATGHSARDIYEMLCDSRVALEPKTIAIGTRVEHPQTLIDKIQYHSNDGRGKYLPAAEYTFTAQVGERGVYSFCMCPGGIIVPASTAPGQLVVNGMSPHNRGSKWANSGIVVEVRPGDFPEYEGPLQMMHLQQDIEKRFFENEKDTKSNPLNAPAQRLTDFINGKKSATLPPTSYAPGIHSAEIGRLLPEFISSRLREGYKVFGKRRQGFVTKDAILVGLESRTSAPVSIPRIPETCEHPEIAGLYAVGEGAGQAGGIVSAALDGMKAASAIADKVED